MMKSIVLCMLLLCTAATGVACNVCGASASNQSFGILPQFHKHFIGIQYQHRSFTSEHPVHDNDAPSAFSKEYYSTVQAWGRYNAGKVVQLFVFVPYVSNLKVEQNKRTTVSGPGDISLLANLRVIGKNRQQRAWKHYLQLGGGLKAPTGVYDVDAIKAGDGLPNFQPGTHSWDFLGNINYTLRYKKMGINIEASSTITTPNEYHYKFGNRFSAGALAFYWYGRENLTILPQAGLRVDIAGADYERYDYRWKNEMSGGHQIYFSAGLQAYYARFGAQLGLHRPVYQGYASGLVEAALKTEMAVYFLF